MFADRDGGRGGAARWNNARSCASVSRMSEVMSGVFRRALVKILGPGKGREAIDWEQRDIWERCESRSEVDMVACAIDPFGPGRGCTARKAAFAYTRCERTGEIDELDPGMIRL